MSVIARIWGLLAPTGLWLVAVLIAVQTFSTLDARWLWYSDEVRYIEAFTNLIENGRWLVLEQNGELYPDKPPVYFWLLAGIHWATGLDYVPVMFAGSAVSAILLVAAMWYLGGAMGVPRAARSAGLLTWLGGLGVIVLLHYVRMDLLFVAMMLAGHAALHEYVFNDKGPGRVYAAFFVFGLAVLTKGPLGVALPLAALVACTLYNGPWRRLLTRPMAGGVLVLLGVLAAWALGVILVEGWDFFYGTMIGQQVVARATDAFHHKEPLSYYFVVLPVILLPWTGMLLAVPVLRMARGVRDFGARRRARHPADWLAISAVVAFAFLSALDGKVAVYLLPVVCYLHLLLGIALMGENQAPARIACAVLTVALAVALAVLVPRYAIPAGQLWAVIAGVALLALLAAALVMRANPGPRALALGLIGTAMGYTAAAGLFPILNQHMSPKPLADALMQAAAEHDATPMTYRTFGGVFTFYAGQDLIAHDTPEAIRDAIAAPGRVVVLTPEKNWPDDIAGMSQVATGTMIGGRGEYLVLLEQPEG